MEMATLGFSREDGCVYRMDAHRLWVPGSLHDTGLPPSGVRESGARVMDTNRHSLFKKARDDPLLHSS